MDKRDLEIYIRDIDLSPSAKAELDQSYIGTLNLLEQVGTSGLSNSADASCVSEIEALLGRADAIFSDFENRRHIVAEKGKDIPIYNLPLTSNVARSLKNHNVYSLDKFINLTSNEMYIWENMSLKNIRDITSVISYILATDDIYLTNLPLDSGLRSKEAMLSWDDRMAPRPQAKPVDVEWIKSVEEELRAISLADLDLGTRAYSVLKSRGIRTAKDLVTFVSEHNDLRSLRNIGAKSESEILSVIEDLHSKEFRDLLHTKERKILEVHIRETNATEAELSTIAVADLDISTKITNFLLSQNVSNVKELIDLVLNNNLLCFPGIGPKTVSDIVKIVKHPQYNIILSKVQFRSIHSSTPDATQSPSEADQPTNPDAIQVVRPSDEGFDFEAFSLLRRQCKVRYVILTE